MTLDTCKCEDRLKTEVVLLGGRREEGRGRRDRKAEVRGRVRDRSETH